MSAVISAVSADSVVILADGAAYNEDGRVIAFQRKVYVSDRVPVAVACRGRIDFCETAAAKIIMAVERFGFDRIIQALDASVEGFFRRNFIPLNIAFSEFLQNKPLNIAFSDFLQNQVEVLIAGISETGPQQRVFRNVQMGQQKESPLTLFDPGELFIAIPGDGRAYDVVKDMGISPSRNETWHSILSRYGIEMFEFFRRIQAPPEPGDERTEPRHLIGGFLEMTVVAPSGVTTRQIHRWPDTIGEHIDPFRTDKLRSSTC